MKRVDPVSATQALKPYALALALLALSAPVALAAGDPFGGLVAIVVNNIRNWCSALALAGGAYLGMKWMFGDQEAPHQTRGYLMGALILAIVSLGLAGWTTISGWFNVT